MLNLKYLTSLATPLKQILNYLFNSNLKFSHLAGSVADVQAAIEHIYPLVYEFKKPRAQQQIAHEEEPEPDLETVIVESDMDDDSDIGFDDPLALNDDDELSPPASKKQKLRDISHLQKKYKGPPPGKRSNNHRRSGGVKRPLGKMNDPKKDSMYVSDGDIDGDDF